MTRRLVCNAPSPPSVTRVKVNSDHPGRNYDQENDESNLENGLRAQVSAQPAGFQSPNHTTDAFPASPASTIPLAHSSISTTATSKTIHSHLIPACHGFALHLPAQHSLRITDLHGSQVVDFFAWLHPYSPSSGHEHFSASYTRYNLGSAAPPAVGEHLYSNHDRKMFTVVRDTVKMHDMMYMACNPGFYKRAGLEGHRSCAENAAEAMSLFLEREERCQNTMAEKNKGINGNVWASKGPGMATRGGKIRDLRTKTRSDNDEMGERETDGQLFKWQQIHDPFNVFQNTPYYALKGGIDPSKPGDYIELRAEMDVVVALSCCPYAEIGFNGGKVTDVLVTWEGK